MQEIERYGLITLLFLVVSAIAVMLWDGTDPAEDGDRVRAAAVEAERGGAPAAAADAQRARRRESERLTRHAPVAEDRPGAGAPGRAAPGAADAPRRGASAQPLFDAETQALLAARRGGEAGRGTNVTPGPSGAVANLNPAAAGRPAPARGAGRTAGAVPQSPIGTGIVEPRRGAEDDRQPDATPRQVPLPANETLSHLAQRYLGSAGRWREIAAVNPGLDVDRIAAGTLITLPVATDAAADSAVDSAVDAAAGAAAGAAADPVADAAADAEPPAAAVAAAPSSAPVEGGPEGPANTRAYVVARGDSAWKIAERELGDGARYRELGPLNPGVDLDSLKEGAVLRLPAGAVAQVDRPRRSGVR